MSRWLLYCRCSGRSKREWRQTCMSFSRADSLISFYCETSTTNYMTSLKRNPTLYASHESTSRMGIITRRCLKIATTRTRSLSCQYVFLLEILIVNLNVQHLTFLLPFFFSTLRITLIYFLFFIWHNPISIQIYDSIRFIVSNFVALFDIFIYCWYS